MKFLADLPEGTWLRNDPAMLAVVRAWSWFSVAPEVAEHLRIRTMLMEEVLSPVNRSKVSEMSDYPLFYNEDCCADYDDEKGKTLIDKALHEEDVDADATLCEIIFQHVLQQRKLPLNLSVFLMVRMRERFEHVPQRPRETKRTNFRDRNMFIVCMVAELRTLGIAPTRNRAATDPCGCSIVADALTKIGKPTTERAVEEVWISRDDVPLE